MSVNQQQAVQIVTPPARWVQGSFFRANTQTMDGRPLVWKSGQNAGQPRKEWFVAVAIPKGQEKHWNETLWGQAIWTVGMQAHPNFYRNSNFAWKVLDGDSEEADANGRKPRDKIGFAGHWIVRGNSSYTIPLYEYRRDHPNYAQEITDDKEAVPGDYIRLKFTVGGGDPQAPIKSVYINPLSAALVGKGEPIPQGTFGRDNSGFDDGQQPVQTQPLHPTAPSAPAAAVAAPPPPHPDILGTAPPAPPPAAPAVSLKDPSVTLDAMRNAGWTDAQLRQHGHLV